MSVTTARESALPSVTVTTAATNASARTAASAPTRTANASARPGGRVSSANFPVVLASSAKAAKSSALAWTAPLVITSLVFFLFLFFFFLFFLFIFLKLIPFHLHFLAPKIFNINFGYSRNTLYNDIAPRKSDLDFHRLFKLKWMLHITSAMFLTFLR